MLVDTLKISKTVVHFIVTDESIIRKVRPKLLTDEQKANKVLIASELKECMEIKHDYLVSVITGDETWTYMYDSKKKHQSDKWHTSASPKTKKARMSKFKVETMLIVFWRQGYGPQRVFTLRIDRQRCLLRGCSGKIEENIHPLAKRHCSYLGAASRQCAQSYVSACPWVHSKAQRGNTPIVTQQSWPSSVRLFFLPVCSQRPRPHSKNTILTTLKLSKRPS